IKADGGCHAVPKTLSDVHKLGDEVYEYENPPREPKVEALAGALPRDRTKHDDQNRKGDKARERIEIHARPWRFPKTKYEPERLCSKKSIRKNGRILEKSEDAAVRV